MFLTLRGAYSFWEYGQYFTTIHLSFRPLNDCKLWKVIYRHPVHAAFPFSSQFCISHLWQFFNLCSLLKEQMEAMRRERRIKGDEWQETAVGCYFTATAVSSRLLETNDRNLNLQITLPLICISGGSPWWSPRTCHTLQAERWWTPPVPFQSMWTLEKDITWKMSVEKESWKKRHLHWVFEVLCTKQKQRSWGKVFCCGINL